MPSTNIFHMPTKCIYTHIHEMFMIQSHIQAYKGDANIYGPLWTPTCICTMWTYFLIMLYIFPSLILSQKDFITPHIIDNRMTDFFHHHSIMYVFTPLYSPVYSTFSVIFKDNFPLVYIVGAYMLISIYAQGQSKYIFRFSLILFFYHIPFTVRIL